MLAFSAAVLSMTLNCSSRSEEGGPERLRERRPDQLPPARQGSVLRLRGGYACWLVVQLRRLFRRCGLGWASARKPRAPSQEPSKRFGVWDPHENPGHRPNDRNPVTTVLSEPDNVGRSKKKKIIIVSWLKHQHKFCCALDRLLLQVSWHPQGLANHATSLTTVGALFAHTPIRGTADARNGQPCGACWLSRRFSTTALPKSCRSAVATSA